MTSYIEYATTQAAMDASASAWGGVLGRPKNPQDVTQFLYHVVSNPNDGSALGVISDNVVAETPVPVGGLLSASNPAVAATLAAVAATAPTITPVNPLPPVGQTIL